jgi:hypothetical protein
MVSRIASDNRDVVITEDEHMLSRPKLGCLFCGKSAAEVSKLVAGPGLAGGSPGRSQ